jgi:hypothetical protein
LPNGTNERGLAVATIRDNQVVVIDPGTAQLCRGRVLTS